MGTSNKTPGGFYVSGMYCTWIISGRSGTLHCYGHTDSVCPVVRPALFFRLLSGQRIFGKGNRLHAVGGYFPGTEYPYYFCIYRRPDRCVANQRHHSLYPILCGGIHTSQVFRALHLPPVFFHVLPHRYLLWHGKYHGSHMHAHIECSRLKPFSYRRRHPLRKLFRGPLLPHVLQRPADMQPDPDRHLSEHKAYVPQQRGSFSRNMHPLCSPGFRFQRSGGQGAPGPVQDKFLPPLGCHASGCPDSGSVPVASGCKICHGRQHCSRCRRTGRVWPSC